jgi:HK97 gp10 family phage protein
MANNVEVTITGLEELQDKLNRLPIEFSRKAIRHSLSAGAKVMQHEIETLASTGKYVTGWLASQVYTRVKTNNLDEGSARVTFTRKQNPARIGKEKQVPSAIQEALWSEFGTVKEPPKPLIRAAFAASESHALDTFVADLKDQLNDTFR